MTQIDRRQGVYQQAAIKLPCRVVSTSNITLDGLQTIDGVAVVADDRVLVTGQTDTTENGIYAADTGEWSRTEDFDGSRDVVKGTIVSVTSGTLYAESVWHVTTTSPAVGSAMAWARMGASALSLASAFMLTVLDDLTAAAARTTLGAVGLTGNETVAGNKAFSGVNTHSGGDTFTGTVTMTAKPINQAQGVDIASATTTDIGAATGNYVKITGTTTITGLGTIQAGTQRRVEFTGALLLTHNAASLILPGGANITTAAGDCADFVSEGSGNWRCLQYARAAARGATAFLAADVTLNNVATFFDGPNTGALPPGMYYLSAVATVQDNFSAAAHEAAIHDGSSYLVATTGRGAVTSESVPIPLSIVVTTTATTTFTLRVKDQTSTQGVLLKTGIATAVASKSTWISWIRIL